jgi:hypothetical protein
MGTGRSHYEPGHFLLWLRKIGDKSKDEIIIRKYYSRNVTDYMQTKAGQYSSPPLSALVWQHTTAVTYQIRKLEVKSSSSLSCDRSIASFKLSCS